VGYRFEQSSNPETPGEKLLYEVLQRFMLIIAREPTLRAPLAEDAAAYVGLDNEPDSLRIAPGQLETVLSIGVQDLGEPFFDKLVELALNTENPAIRSNAIGSLARVEDPELVKKLQVLTLSGAFKGTEVASIIGRQMVRAATTQLTYEFLKENVIQIIELTPGTFRSTIVPGFGGSLCSATQIIEWRNILKSHEALIPGYERSMEQVIESNELCNGLKSRNASSLVAYLSTQ
jgi:hypothetical protein